MRFIITMLVSSVILGSLAFGIGYSFGIRANADELAAIERDSEQYRLAADQRIAELGSALDGARARSERASRGLEESARTANGIADRNLRIIHLVRAIRTAVQELTGGDDERARTIPPSTAGSDR